VPFISAFLSDRGEEWSPKRLKANEGLAYQGSIVLGMGFVLAPDDAHRMLDADPKNAEVIFPYINGDDLNSDPEQRPSRWAINFWDWPEARAQKYRLPYEWIEERVKPERAKNARKERRERWWQFAEKTPALYHSIGRGHPFERHPKDWSPDKNELPRVIAFATQASKYAGFSFAPSDILYSNAVGVIADSSASMFAELASALHVHWAFAYGGRLETRLRYAPTDCFETYPFLHQLQPELSHLGEQLSRIRRSLMAENGTGITKIYNQVNSSEQQQY